MRLIDADKLNNAIESDFDEVCVYDVEPNEAVMDFQRIVDEQPTAYDVDKIIEQLESEATLADIDGIGNCYAIDFQTAVIMAKKGGGSNA